MSEAPKDRQRRKQSEIDALKRKHESVSPTELHFEGAYAAFYAAEVQRSYD